MSDLAVHVDQITFKIFPQTKNKICSSTQNILIGGARICPSRSYTAGIELAPPHPFFPYHFVINQYIIPNHDPLYDVHIFSARIKESSWERQWYMFSFCTLFVFWIYMCTVHRPQSLWRKQSFYRWTHTLPSHNCHCCPVMCSSMSNQSSTHCRLADAPSDLGHDKQGHDMFNSLFLQGTAQRATTYSFLTHHNFMCSSGCPIRPIYFQS